MKLSRREFILASSGVLLASRVRGFSSDKRHVIIAGAGLAGLSAAYELSEKGFNVTVIEGRDRIGGRILTLREPFSDELKVEAGGELIGENYERMLRYAEKFGIEYQELSTEVETGGSVAEIQDGIGRTAYLKGKLYPKSTRIKKHPYGLKGMEARVLPPTLYGMNLRLMNNEIRKGVKTLADFDKVSLADALRKKGVSDQAIKLINISLNYNSIETVSAGAVLQDSQKRREAGIIPIKVKGGNDQITNAIANAARENGVKFILSSKVKRIHQSDNGIKVFFQTSGGNVESIAADKLVCTIPFSVLKAVEFSPRLPSNKNSAINKLDYTQNTRVHLQTKYAEWDKRALGSSVWTDTSIERIFSPVATLGDENAIFSVWTDGDGSKTLENMPEQQRMNFAQQKFEEILPFMKGSVEKTHTLSWSQDEFVRGTYSHLKVGQLSSIQPHIKTSVGNIHFAGEHTAEIFPGMEGALESADRVVSEITAKK